MATINECMLPIGLKQQKISEKKFAIFDGTDFVFVESDWYIINILRILWRYGFSYLRMQLWVEDVVDRFMRFVCFSFFMMFAIL